MNAIKGILCDLDNTLYDYEQTHQKAMSAALNIFCDETKIDLNDSEALYIKARTQINEELKNTAASHNRLLYFQRMLEISNFHPLTCAFESYDCYWNTFINSIKLFDGVMDFFTLKNSRSIAIVTDLSAEIQHRKLHDLNLFNYVDVLITSEEAGEDKPNPSMFQCALRKMNLNAADVVMIGDNYQKDIIGANQCGIKALWLNRDQETRVASNNPDIIEFTSFKEIQTFLNHA